MSSLSLLPASTVHRIASSQVITSVSTAIKELVENALDAGADNVEVKLEEHGLSRIEVRDNGCGIKREDAQVMAQRYYTSKINCFENLNELTTYGFRGEALSSLCAVSNVSITTKTKNNAVAICYTLGQSGKVFSTRPLPSATGTTVVVTNLFKNLPVRKQFLSSKKKCKEELKRVEELIMSFGCIHPEVRLVLWHNKSIIWQKGKVSDYKTSLVTVLGTPVVSKMEKVEYKDEDYGFQLTGYLPKMDSDPSITCRATNDRCFIFVNDRPVLIKEVSQLVKELYSPAGNRYPIMFLSIKLPPDGVDVNLEPNKTRVLLTEKERILESFKATLENFYKKVVQNNKEKSSSSSEDEGLCTIMENCTNKTLNAINVIEREKQLDNQQITNDKGANSSSIAKQSINDSQIDGAINTIVSSKVNNVFSIDNELNISVNETVDIDQPEESSLAKGALVSVEYRNENMKCATADHRESVAITTNPSALAGSLHNQEANDTKGTANSVNEEPCAVVQNSITLLSTSAKTTQEHDKAKYTTDPAEDYLTGNTQTSLTSTGASILNVTKEITVVNESSQKLNPSLDKEDVSNIYKLLDFSENESQISCFNDEGTVEFPTPPNEQSQLHQDKETSKKNKDSFDLDDVFNDGMEFDQILQDVVDKKACSQSSQSTQSSETSTQTAASKVKELIDLNIRDVCGRDWSMGNILKDKNDNLLEPSKLLTPSLKPLEKKKTSPSGKRKHSGDKSLSLKRNKKHRKASNQENQVINQSLLTIHVSQSPQQRYEEAKKVDVPFSMSSLKSSYNSNSRRSKSSSSKHHLIGRLEPSGVWLMLKENEISFVNQYRIQEQILFHKLMQTHSLIGEKLEKSINLESRLIGGEECWSILTKLESESQLLDNTRLITDERIKSNGFDIRIKDDPDSDELKIDVLGITTSLPFYGIPDLAEILGLIKESDPKTCSLSECRPLKVINYLRGEAVRVCRGLSTRMCRDDVERTLTQMDEYLPKHVTSCLHQKPFTGHVATIPALS